MTAKEMFKKLGYKVAWSLEETDGKILVFEDEDKTECFDCNYTKIIKFHIETKTYIVFEEYNYFGNSKDELGRIEKQIISVSFSEHQAITQQMKELGWLE